MAKCSTPFHSSRSKLAILEASKLAEYSSKSNSPLVPVVVFVVRDQGDCGKRIELNPFKSLPDVRFNQLHPSYSPPDVQCKQLHPSYYYVPDFNATSCIPPITMYQISMHPAASLLLLCTRFQCNQLHPSYYYVPDSNATSCIPPVSTRCSVRSADALAVHPYYIFGEKQIDSIRIYMSVCGF